MNHKLLLMLALALLSLNAWSQAKITMKGDWMYTDVALSNGGSVHNVPGLIDTGCSVCIIDSTYAVDSCHIKAQRPGIDRYWLLGLYHRFYLCRRLMPHQGFKRRQDNGQHGRTKHQIVVCLFGQHLLCVIHIHSCVVLHCGFGRKAEAVRP